MATRTAETPSLAGLAATYHAADAAGDKFSPTLSTVLHVQNTSAGAVTVTIVTPRQIQGLDVADVAVSVPASSNRFIGPFNPDTFAGTDGLASITWGATAGMSFAVLRV